MKSDYFVEFLNHDLALRNEEQFKFLINKYKQDMDLIRDYKLERINGINQLITILNSLELELKNFKKLMPVPPQEEQAQAVTKRKKQKKEKREVKPKNKQKTKEKPKIVANDLKKLKLGLEQIRDELERM